GGVVLDLCDVTGIRDVDDTSLTVDVLAGTFGDHYEAQLRANHGLTGGHWPQSMALATVGGWIACRGAGQLSGRYGKIEDMVVGLEVALANGTLLRTGGAPRSAVGPDLTQLFVGSEGTLGVITGAVLRLFPATPRHATAWVAVPGVGAAVALLGVAQQHAGAHLSTFEIANRQALELVLAHLPGASDPLAAPSEWYVLVELAGAESDGGLDDALESILGEAVERDLASDAAVAGSRAQRSALWALREGISEAQKVEGATLKHDVTLSIARLADWVAEIGPVLEQRLPGVRPVTYGHVGDGNLHYNLSAPAGGDDDLRAAAADLSTAIYDAVAAGHGSISAEHGLGRTKAAAGASYKSAVEVDLMRAVKQALDPDGLMNPGVLLPG
ncbi:FAD-binding oxidoreductase, partial [Nocardioides sp.]|uniref:FAD-binding oxidoreductase n=1 Tax=Nocardioides sp. TaxID=35761 RepID=UPI0026351A26